MRKSRQGFIAVCVMVLFAASAVAAPLSVRVDDHIFSFETAPGTAAYSFNGVEPDTLTVGAETGAVSSYRYSGISASAGVAPDFYPVWMTDTVSPFGVTDFGGSLVMDLAFDDADGPYTSPIGDEMDISLDGAFGHLTITGQLGAPYMPAAAAPVVLLDMSFDLTSLLARADVSEADLIEASGRINTLLGEDVQNLDLDGVVKFSFFADDDLAKIFDSSTIGDPAEYRPSMDIQDVVPGHVAGVTGDGAFTIPEPTTLSLVALAAVAGLRRIRRR